MKMTPPRLRPLLPAIRSLTRQRHHRAITTTTILQKSKMPPPPPNPPLSYSTASRVHPYLVRYHPLKSSSSSFTDPRKLITHRLAVGAAVLNLTSTPHKVLVLQRSAIEKALPLRWELPGGAAEAADGDLVASATRELWEETGLRAKTVGGLVGSYKWSGFGPSEDAPVAPGAQALALPGGGVGIGGSGPSRAGVKVGGSEGGGDGRSPEAAKGRDAWRKFTYLVEVEGDGEAEVKIDPEEHETFVWATEEEVRADQAGEVKFEWTSEHQKRDILEAFAMAKKQTRACTKADWYMS